MKYYCNPINYGYRYQFNKQPDGRITASREGADPSLVYFKGKYLLFPSMTAGFLASDDLVSWELHSLAGLPAYDYAPDVRVVGEWLYFCASNHDHGIHYRTRDPFSGQWEKIPGQFPFWDPNLFADEDGRLYFYWGSSTTEPIYGVELDRATMRPIGEKVGLVYGDPSRKGFERTGEDHVPERSPEEQAAMLAQLDSAPMPEDLKQAARSYITGAPYIEGVWINKHNGRYYLQYGASGSRFNVYGDGVYVSDRPLGPYMLAENNPYSYKPGGFLPGAGHGSTLEDPAGGAWHTSTMRICVNHNFERRVGLWPAGWDEDGELFCNQRYGDWPFSPEVLRGNPWADPEWMLLSYGKAARASSAAEGRPPEHVTDEDVRTVWRASSTAPGQWVEVDLGRVYDVRAVQVNFGDDGLTPPLPDGAALHGTLNQEQWIDEMPQATRWKLEGSADQKTYFVIEDKADVGTDLPHDLVVRESGIQARYLRLTVLALPYGQAACVSGLRIFGLGHAEKPAAVEKTAIRRAGEQDLVFTWQGDGAGYVLLWGHRADKLYHSRMTFHPEAPLGALVQGQELYIRVDSFNESGITPGTVQKVPLEELQ